MKNKITEKVLVAGTVLAMMSPLSISAQELGALEGNTYQSLGVNVTQDQSLYNKTVELLGTDNLTDENTVVVDGPMIDKYLKTGSTEATNVYSSSSIEFSDKNIGVEVEIVTPENIQGVSKETYTNAAITSGIKNARIKVASENPVTGEGALVGIYAVMESEGVLNQDSVDLAQEEIGLINDIGEGTEDEKANAVMTDVKSEIAQAVQNGDIVNGDKITEIVNNVTNNYNITLSPENQARLEQYAETFSSLPIAQDSEALEQLGKLSNDLFEKGGEIFDGISSKVQEKWADPEVQESAKGFFESIKQSFSRFVDFVGSLFSSEGTETTEDITVEEGNTGTEDTQ